MYIKKVITANSNNDKHQDGVIAAVPREQGVIGLIAKGTLSTIYTPSRPRVRPHANA